jgi:DNA repair protein RadC
MPGPERFQLPFLFPDRSAVRYEYGFVSHDNAEDGSRFVRKLRETVQVRTPNDVAYHLMTNVFNPFDAFDQEELWTLQLDTKNNITHEAMVYRGTVNAVHVRIAELFKEAVRVNAPSIILAHPHPSGDPTASPEDVRVTESCYLAGKLLGIELLDHVIVGRDSWVSMKERGLGFQPKSTGWDASW